MRDSIRCLCRTRRWPPSASTSKHLSFVEDGRSWPSRQLFVDLAQRLDLPMAARNRLLLAGGFAPAYLEPLYDGDPMRSLRESLRRLLAARKPIPTSIGTASGTWSRPTERCRCCGTASMVLEPAGHHAPQVTVHPDGLPSVIVGDSRLQRAADPQAAVQ